MNLAINNFLTIFAFFILNLRFVSSVLYLAIYSFAMCYSVNESIFPLKIVNSLRTLCIALWMCWTLIFYIDDRESKKNFLNKQKIQRLLKEEREILNTLPDGLIIHQGKELKFLNSTFKKMFDLKTSRNSLSEISNRLPQNHMSSIFMKKTQYKINNQKNVEQK